MLYVTKVNFNDYNYTAGERLEWRLLYFRDVGFGNTGDLSWLV